MIFECSKMILEWSKVMLGYSEVRSGGSDIIPGSSDSILWSSDENLMPFRNEVVTFRSMLGISLWNLEGFRWHSEIIVWLLPGPGSLLRNRVNQASEFTSGFEDQASLLLWPGEQLWKHTRYLKVVRSGLLNIRGHHGVNI